MQSDIVREHANIPEDQVIMTCVAMGLPRRQLRSERRKINPTSGTRSRKLRRFDD